MKRPKDVRGNKLLELAALLRIRETWRKSGRTVVWTNGCFDLLHIGHVRSLQAARSFGDALIVGIKSDDSVRRLKGPERPLVPAEERAEILAALECVDAVIVFDEDTPERMLARLRPDIHCKGAEYAPPNGRPIPEAELVRSYGGKVEFLPLVEQRSTTGLITKIRSDTA